MALTRLENVNLCINSDKLFVVETIENWNECLPIIMHDLKWLKLLGLDAEWITRDRKMRPVSLLQIATLQGTCVLIRLHLLSRIPSTLQQMLADKSIIKAGVAIRADAQKLFASHGLVVNSCVDLRNLAHRVRINANAETRRSYGGLQGIALSVLGVQLDKDKRLSCSNWESPVLSRAQLEYAARDAYVGVFAFWRMISMKITGNSSITGASGDNAAATTTSLFCACTAQHWAKALSFCQGLLDVDYKSVAGARRPASTAAAADTVETLHQPQQLLKTDSSVKAGDSSSSPSRPISISRAYSARKTPLYDHCALHAPDGQLLCTCDRKKAQWYTAKGLGVKVSDDPFIVRLTFEPSGRPIDEENYYTQDKLNICVVCGADDTYIRKSIIPHDYRKYFPQVLKEHRSHDVVLMCIACHQRSNLHDAALKQRLAEETGAPLEAGQNGRYRRDHSVHKVKSAAKALFACENNKNVAIPQARREALTQTVQEYFNVQTVTVDLLERAINLDPKIEAQNFQAHGQQVFLHYRAQPTGLLDFEKRWRQHFLDTMQPKYMPNSWKVDFRHTEMLSLQNALSKLAEAMCDLFLELMWA